jgi:hypothetical protein
MFPFTGQPAVHCSTIRTKSFVFGFSLARPPHREKKYPNPPSRRNLLLTGDEYVACWNRIGPRSA